MLFCEPHLKFVKTGEPICQIKFLKDVHKDVEDFVGSLLKNDVTPKGNSSFVIKLVEVQS